MKKIFTKVATAMSVLTLSAMTVSAAPTLPGFERNLVPSAKNFSYEVSASKTVKTVSAKADNAPATLVGKEYVFIGNNGDYKENVGVTVAADKIPNGIVFEGLAGGYNVRGTYNASTGTVTIPTNVVIGTHKDYGDITLYALDLAAQKYYSSNIIGTVKGDTISFNYGLYGLVKAGALVVLGDLNAYEANANAMIGMQGQTIKIPLLATKKTDGKLSIVGLSNLVYGAYYDVPLFFDATAKTGYISNSQTVDYVKLSSGTRSYILRNGVDGGNVNFTISASENATAINSDTKVKYVYNNGLSWSGYQFDSYQINLNYNLFTAQAEGEDEGDEIPAEITTGNIKYSLDKDNKTATVIGAEAGIAVLTVPNTITVRDITFDVVAVAKAAFQANSAIKSISLPKSLKKIDTDAFRNVRNLSELKIEDLASWCAVELANGNANPIYNVFPTSTSKWGKVYFNGEQVSTNLVIPEGVTSIGRCFYGFKSLTSVSLPSTLTAIGDQAFANCLFTEIEIPGSVKSIGSSFFGCNKLEKIILNEGLETLGNAFYGTSALKKLTLPSTLKEFNSTGAFSSYLEELTVLATVPPTFKYQSADMYFDSLDIPVKVPAASLNAYKEASVWKELLNLQALQGSGVVDIEINDATAEKIFFNLQGQRVENPSNGIFIEVSGKTAKKVIVK